MFFLENPRIPSKHLHVVGVDSFYPRVFPCFFGILIWGFVLLFGVSTVHARAEYNRQFWAFYKVELGKYAETTRCQVCHFGNDKENRNDYGQAVGKSLDGTSVKDVEKIRRALQAAAKKESSTPGKSFGDLIEAGQLPGKRPE